MKYIALIGFCLLFNNAFAQKERERNIVSCFSQNGGNNCASIALIKAAMLKYGYSGMFDLQTNESGYVVTLKNGVILSISEEELQQAKESAAFELHDVPDLGQEQSEVIKYAYLAYATIAKSIVKSGYWGCVEQNNRHYTDIKTYKDALWFISKRSFCTDNCYRLLGYKIRDNKVFEFTNPAQVAEKGTILYSWPHAVVTCGAELDCYGNWLPVQTSKICNNRFEFYIVLE